GPAGSPLRYDKAEADEELKKACHIQRPLKYFLELEDSRPPDRSIIACGVLNLQRIHFAKLDRPIEMGSSEPVPIAESDKR
ncbi:hypothetical protein ACQKHI_27935, partial [Escherichia coli]|uniref:hypothetical protein n=1 Tax=Escherichia coli TaxID=562 RepID=UPI003D05282E